jgi:glucokinase
VTRPVLAGVDVGGSKIAVVVADASLRLLARRVVQTGVGGAEHAVERIAAALDPALDDAGCTAGSLAAIGVGVPGRVDPSTGRVTLAVNLGWHALPLGPLLEARYGVPVAIENDVRAAAAGLYERGVAGEGDDLAYLSIGTGISAGVVLDGRLHRGPRGLAGEIGHVVMEPGGPACMCGLHGCLEALASGRAVAARLEAAIAEGATSSLAGTSPMTAIDVYRAAAAGDPLALHVADTAGHYVARAIHELVMAYDVRRVVLGGGVTTAGRIFLDPVERGLDGLRAASELAREALPEDVVHLLPPDADAGGWGGVILARAATRGAAAIPPAPVASGAATRTETREPEVRPPAAPGTLAT